MTRRIWLLLCPLATILLLLARPCVAQSELEARNKVGLLRNPPGMQLLLRTKEAKLTFHLFETIPIELVFSSTVPSTYSIELDETMNFAGGTDYYNVEPAQSTLLAWQAWGQRGVICCDSDRHLLSKEPMIFNRELTDYVRFEREGTYRVYLTTRRVFKGPRKYDDFKASTIVLTSNILTLTILPDDSEWDAQHLAETLCKLHDPHVKANYDLLEKATNKIHSEVGRSVAMTNRVSQSEFVKSQKALNAMDSEDAIRARISLMAMTPKEDIDSEREFGGGYVSSQPLLDSTTRPDVLVAFLEQRAENPDFGVDYDYVEWWAKYIVLRDHPEMFRPLYDEAARYESSRPYLSYNTAAKQEIVTRLESILGIKTPSAKALAALTIKDVKADITYLSKKAR
jgi:hypothetical protein